MKQAAKKVNSNENSKNNLTVVLQQRIYEGLLVFMLGVAIYLLVALFSYHPADPGWSQIGGVSEVSNAGGRAGAWFADVFLYIFGVLAYLFPVMVGYVATLMLHEQRQQQSFDASLLFLRISGLVLMITSVCGLISLNFVHWSIQVPASVGGVLGDLVGLGLAKSFNIQGTTLLLVAVFFSSVTLLTGMSWLKLVDALGCFIWNTLDKLRYSFVPALQRIKTNFAVWKQKRQQAKLAKAELKAEKQAEKKTIKIVKQQTTQEEIERSKPRIEPKLDVVPTSKRAQQDKQVPLFKVSTNNSLPSLGLLDAAKNESDKGYSEEKLQHLSEMVEAKLKDFGIKVEVVAVHPGPVITRFELDLAPGIKVSRITALSKDLARALSVTSVRIVEVIPGKTVIGLELPNEHREMVALSEVLSSRQYEQARSPLSLALGKDIAGHPVIVDLAKMPHLLVAGTTGSGKSVGLNVMLLSLLYKSSPNEVRLILIDPKMLELSIYEGIPHLLTPVIVDMKEAANGLRWCVAEMERRYRLMAALGVRSLTNYNAKIREAEKAGTPITDPTWQEIEGEEAPVLDTLPYIVVLIDEFADMMMVVGKKVEELIARIAQKARAAGIHLILATQRPSVDVITGLIKANVPTRIAFQVSSKIDSRTIIDQQGAEQLLGHGDMLYLPPGTSIPVRVHGAFVDDHEVHKVVHDWRERAEPSYIEEITCEESSMVADSDWAGGDKKVGGHGEADPLYDEAVAFVTQARRVSISSVQRRFRIGYNRAATIVEEMERSGVISSAANGAREVLAPAPVKD